MMTPMAQNRKRVELEIYKKKQILDLLEKKVIMRSIAKQYGISKTTVVNIANNRHEILKMFNDNCGNGRKRKARTTKNENINIHVLDFFQICQSKNVSLTGAMLQKKAREIAKVIGLENFYASNGWLQSFLKRNKINLKLMHNAESTEPRGEHMGERKDAHLQELASDDNFKTMYARIGDESTLSNNQTPNENYMETDSSYNGTENTKRVLEDQESPRTTNNVTMNTVFIKQEENSINYEENDEDTAFQNKSSKYETELSIKEDNEIQETNDRCNVFTMTPPWTSLKTKHERKSSVNSKGKESLTFDVISVVQEHLKKTNVQEDRFDICGKTIAIKLRNLPREQMLIAEKIINDTLFKAEMGILTYENFKL